MKLTTVARLAGFLLLSLLQVSYVTAQDDDNNKPKVLKVDSMQQGNFGLPAIVPGPYDTRETACKKYAKDTVEQLTWLDNMNCGYGKNPGTNSSLLISYDLEYNNCMNNIHRRMGEEEFHLSDISSNIEKRQKAIADCICKHYAENAVQQNDENILLGCGYKGGRWSSDFDYHYNWCAHGGGNIIEARSWERFKLARVNDLNECKKPLAPINLKAENGLNIVGMTPTLTWIDPGEGKAKAADSYWLEVLVNGKKVGVPGVIVPRWTFPAGVLPYSAQVKWKVKGRNNFGESSWSDVSLFQVKNEPPPPPPPPSTQAGINVSACFMLLGRYSSDVTAYAKGQVIKATGNSGKKTFSISKKVPANHLTSMPFPGFRNCITMSASGIIEGLWNITVWTDVTGVMTCKKIKVPRVYVNADFTSSPPMCH